MEIEIVSIGDELLKGTTINTNAAFISKELFRSGYKCRRQQVFSDDPTTLQENLMASLDRASLVITTGGLGPTIDDLTKEVLAKVFEEELTTNNELFKELQERFPSTPNLEGQAKQLKNATFFINTIGTAAGFFIEKESKALIALPGVPKEMQKMFIDEIIPFIKKRFPMQERYFSEHLCFCQLRESEIDEYLKEMQKIDREVEIGIYPGLSLVNVTFSLIEKSPAAAKKRIAPLQEKLKDTFSDYLFSEKDKKIEEVVHETCLKQNITLGFAESCTGGALSAKITAMPNCSNYFLGSFVSYSNEAKKDWLQVKKETLQSFGAVSPETVNEMLAGVFAETNADLAVAISGIAGPEGGTLDKPVGTVFVGLGKRNGPFYIGKIFSRGQRAFIIEYTCNFALSSLWRLLEKNQAPRFV